MYKTDGYKFRIIGEKAPLYSLFITVNSLFFDDHGLYLPYFSVKMTEIYYKFRRIREKARSVKIN